MDPVFRTEPVLAVQTGLERRCTFFVKVHRQSPDMVTRRRLVSPGTCVLCKHRRIGTDSSIGVIQPRDKRSQDDPQQLPRYSIQRPGRPHN